MKLFFGRLISILLTAGGWVLLAVQSVLNAIGYATLPDDAKVAQGIVQEVLLWILRLPPDWVLLFAIVATLGLMWISWPRPVRTQAKPTKDVDRDQPVRRTLPKQPERVAPVPTAPTIVAPKVADPPKPLTPHAVQRKLVAIDQARDWLEAAKTMFDTWQALLQENWQASVSGQKHPEYAGKINDFIRDLKRLATEIDNFRADRSEYQDISIAMQQLYYNKAREELAEYSAACEAQWHILNAGLPQNTVRRFLAPAFNGFEEALKSANAWRTNAKNALNDLQKEISPI
ncbi:MAG: hypothetical protein WD674_00940 [Cucumibacter sp.]